MCHLSDFKEAAQVALNNEFVSFGFFNVFDYPNGIDLSASKGGVQRLSELFYT
jgi:hypothetical protein